MQTYVALFRGINVSGQKIILMEDLRVYFEKIGFAETKTYIQSGNVVFKSKQKDSRTLSEFIENKIKEKYGFQVPIIIRTEADLNKIIKSMPFNEALLKERERIYISFLSEKPKTESINKFQSYSNDLDKFEIINKEVYLKCKNGYGNTLFSNNFIEKNLGVKSTTRNLETTKKLMELAGNL